MREEDTLPESRSIWQMDCLSISVMLAYAVPMEKLREHARAFMCAQCSEHLDDDGWVLQGLHRACHSPNEISAAVQDYLDWRFLCEVFDVRHTSTGALAQRIEEGRLGQEAMVAMAWALLTDSDAEKILLGNRLVHTLLFRGAMGSAPPQQVPVQMAGEKNPHTCGSHLN